MRDAREREHRAVGAFKALRQLIRIARALDHEGEQRPVHRRLHRSRLRVPLRSHDSRSLEHASAARMQGLRAECDRALVLPLDLSRAAPSAMIALVRVTPHLETLTARGAHRGAPPSPAFSRAPSAPCHLARSPPARPADPPRIGTAPSRLPSTAPWRTRPLAHGLPMTHASPGPTGVRAALWRCSNSSTSSRSSRACASNAQPWSALERSSVARISSPR